MFANGISGALATILGVAFLLHGVGAAALPADREMPIEIQAREALRDESSGLTIYEGDVAIKQGSILIRAEKVSVYNSGRKVDRIVCTGAPARYQQRPEPDAELVAAEANRIEYDLGTDIILLTENAKLEQDASTLTGERIEYDLKREIIRASGGDASGNERIRMVIPPSQQPEID